MEIGLTNDEIKTLQTLGKLKQISTSHTKWDELGGTDVGKIQVYYWIISDIVGNNAKRPLPNQGSYNMLKGA